MRSNLSIAVVILNWNGTRLLEKFLPALIEHTPSYVNIIVGDNASTDQSVSFLKKNFPQVTVLQNEYNYGYAGGYNKILEQVVADYYILLNSDVEVTAGWVEPVIDFMESSPEVAACQPKIRSYINKDYFEYAGAAGGFMDRFGYFFCRGRIFDTLEKDLGQYDDLREIFWASGAAFFVRADWFSKAGGFDAQLFAHMEEIDLCWRLQLLGQKIAYVPFSVVYHIGGGTLSKLSPKKTYLNFRNNLILLYKNLEEGKRFKIICTRFFLDFLALIRFLCLFQFGHAMAISKAHISFIKGLPLWKQTRYKAGLLGNHPRHHQLSGYFKGGIVFQFFIHKKSKFSELNQKNIIKGNFQAPVYKNVIQSL